MYLNMFVRHADTVKMANMAQLVNVIAPVFITDGKIWYQTIFYPLQTFANNCKGTALDAFVDCQTYNVGNDKIPYLDVSTAWDQEGKQIIVNVVNRHKDNAITADILNQNGEFSGKAAVITVNGKNIKDSNSVKEQLVKSEESSLDVNGATVTYSFPAHSYTMIKLPLK